jgi:hypothetical protein
MTLCSQSDAHWRSLGESNPACCAVRPRSPGGPFRLGASRWFSGGMFDQADYADCPSSTQRHGLCARSQTDYAAVSA